MRASTPAALIVLDPLLSRLDAALDTHKDAEVRLALEPLAKMSECAATTIIGLIHVNKSTSDDPLTTLMASRAFAAVARSVLFVMADPDHDGVRLLGQAKNNLGRHDLPTLSFRIVGAHVADTAEGPVWTGKLEWGEESEQTIYDAIAAAASVGNKTAVTEAADWLQDFIVSKGGSADSADVKREGSKAGHSQAALHRARTRLRLSSISSGFPRRTFWSQSSHVQSFHPVGESGTTETTGTTAANWGDPNETTGAQSLQSLQSLQSFQTPRARETTAPKRST